MSGYRGYSAYYRTSGATTSEARSLFERTGNNNVLWNTGTAHIALDTTQQKTLGATTLSGTFTLANINGTSVSVSSSVNGQDYSFTDSIGAFTTFDTLSFFLPRATNNSAASLEFSSLSVTVIPEPATFASLAGLFALLGAAARRRSRR